jgi:ribosomal protein S18 acetylase RimI-like enzyme
VAGSMNEVVGSTPVVEPLSVADLSALNAGGNPRVDSIDLQAVLEHAPGQSFWIPETGEFILVQEWRNRSELPSIHTLWSFTNDDLLLRAAANAAERAGAAALIMLETGERRRPAFYHQHGFTNIEIIRTYEHIEPEVLAKQGAPGVQRFTRVTIDRLDLLEAVLHIDHTAFPWFWWNSRSEFLTYVRYPGVEVWAGLSEDMVVSYFGFTAFNSWAHLDRIAVAPGRQGQGLGRSAVAFATERMLRGGATRVGLSTQSSNRASRHLYETLGFRHTRQSDYDVYGIVFDPDRVNRVAGQALAPDEGWS